MVTHAHLLRRRHRSAGLALALLLLAVSLLAAPPTAAQTTPYTVTWGKQENITKNNGVVSKFPTVAVDSNNKTHIIFSTDDGSILYTNNVGGAFLAPRLVDRGKTSDSVPFYTLAIGPNNTLHLAYSLILSGSQAETYYTRGSLSGAEVSWSGLQKVSESFKSVNTTLAVDKDNNAHVFWVDNRCGTHNVFHRAIYANGTRSAVSAPKPDCVAQARPQAAVTSDGKVHVVFAYNSKDIYYARLESTGWSVQNITADSALRDSNSLNPAIAADGSALYVAWDEGINGHDVLFRRSTDGGASWSTYIAYSSTAALASYPHLAYSASSGRVYIAWGDATNGAGAKTDIWYAEFNPATKLSTAPKRLITETDESIFPTLATGPGRLSLTWMDKRTSGIWQVYHMSGPIDGSNSGANCSGILLLNGGATAINSSTVPAAIAPQNCVQPPTEMQVAVDAPLTDSTPKQPYSTNFNLSIPPGSTCKHSVSVRLITNGVAGQPFSATIVVDTSVNASVRVVNPFLSSNIPLPAPDGGPNRGDPHYTRSGKAFLTVASAGDCVGLQDYTVPGPTGTQMISADPTAAYVDVLVGGASEGEKTFQVTVKDKLGNAGLFPSAAQSFSLIYDTTPPVLDTTTSPTVTLVTAVPTTTVSHIVVRLALDNVRVTDNLYGQREGLPGDAAFWGVYVANSRAANPDPGTLRWVALPVMRPGPRFTFEWSLFGGLDYGPTPGREGDYYVFVRFIDGAGNASVGSVRTAKITLAPGYGVPTAQGAVIFR